MNTFSTFGANYSLKFALTVLSAPNKDKFKRELINFLEKKYQGKVLLTYKCREAITLALLSCALPKGSFVAICQYSCKEVIDAITGANLGVAFVDLEKGTLHFSATTLKKALIKNPKIKAVLVQNTLGYPCQIEGIANICQKKRLVLIEDLAHCVGAYYEKGKEVGSFGDFITLSFSQNKIVDSTSGGALIIRSAKFKMQSSKLIKKEPNFRRQLADRIFPLCSYLIKYSYPLYLLFQKLISLSKPFTNVGAGVHKLPNWYCFVILSRFRNLSSELAHRKKIAGIYARLIKKEVLSAKLTRQISLSANFRFPVFVLQEKEMIDYLAKYKIFLDDPWYTVPGLTLPTRINISERKAEEISMLINRWLGKNRF